MAAKISDLENQLDSLAFRILDLMKQYIHLQKTIEGYLRSGCLDLAKARYITNNRSVSYLQLPTNDAVGIAASFRVVSTIINDNVNFQKYDLEIESSNNSKTFSLEDKKSKEDKRFSSDPLKWFGFLVPHSLRRSKKTFENCLEIILECANVKLELEKCMENYQITKKTIIRSKII